MRKEQEILLLKKSLVKSEQEMSELKDSQSQLRTEEELRKRSEIEASGQREKERLELLHDLEEERGTRREEKAKRLEVITELEV